VAKTHLPKKYRARKTRVQALVVLLFLALSLTALLAERYPIIYESINGLKQLLGFGEFIGLEGPVELVRVSDGDTIVVRFEGSEESLRLIGIDTPEKFASTKLEQDAAASPLSKEEIQVLGEAASSFVKTLLRGKTLYLEFDASERDRYRRLLVYVYFRDAEGDFVFDDSSFKQLNLEIVKAGWAEPLTIPPNVRYANDYLEAANLARQSNKGMWAVLSDE